MKCPHCQQEKVVKNGKSLHGRQRWQCWDCRRTFGESDQRRHPESLKQQALQLYLEGVGLRGIERLLGVSHVAVMHWVKAQAQAQPEPPLGRAEEVEWVECDELCTFIGKKKIFAGSGGLLIVLPKKSAAGRWGIVVPRQPNSFLTSYLAALA